MNTKDCLLPPISSLFLLETELIKFSEHLSQWSVFFIMKKYKFRPGRVISFTVPRPITVVSAVYRIHRPRRLHTLCICIVAIHILCPCFCFKLGMSYPGYPPQSGGYPSQPGQYPPQPGTYPPQSGAYPPQAGVYPPQAGCYPPQAGGYPSQAGVYPPQAGGYPQQGGGYPSQAGGYPQAPPTGRTW